MIKGWPSDVAWTVLPVANRSWSQVFHSLGAQVTWAIPRGTIGMECGHRKHKLSRDLLKECLNWNSSQNKGWFVVNIVTSIVTVWAVTGFHIPTVFCSLQCGHHAVCLFCSLLNCELLLCYEFQPMVMWFNTVQGAGSDLHSSGCVKWISTLIINPAATSVSPVWMVLTQTEADARIIPLPHGMKCFI